MATVCNVSKNEPIKINFLATVQIPVGYKIVDTKDYNLYLTLDSTNLKTDILKELKESVIILARDANGNPTRTINCMSRIHRVALHGTIYYNLVVSKFKTAQALDTPEFTAFSAHDVIPVDVSLGFACPECEFAADSLYGFTVEISKLDEFITTHSGSQVFYNPTDPDEFFAALENANKSEIINVPYTIILTPKGAND